MAGVGRGSFIGGYGFDYVTPNPFTTSITPPGCMVLIDNVLRGPCKSARFVLSRQTENWVSIITTRFRYIQTWFERNQRQSTTAVATGRFPSSPAHFRLIKGWL